MMRTLYFSAALTAMLVTRTQQADASILFIDDDAGTPAQTTWLSTLSSLGYTPTVETLSPGGNPINSLSAYDLVIWSVGDTAYGNLTSANVSTLTSYLNAGGNLLYAGGHNVYEEFAASSFISSYLGLTGYTYNMPTFYGPTVMNGAGHPVTGSNTYNVAPFAPLTYDNMFSGFGVTSALPMLYSPVGAGDGPFAAAVNVTSTFKAMTWGFDLGHLTSESQRQQLLGSSLNYLGASSQQVPEPGSLILLGLGAVSALGLRRRNQLKSVA
jgi:hypothetical protein